MRERKRESGRLLIIVAILAALSSGFVYWKRTVEAPEKAYQEGVQAYGRRAYPRAAMAWQEARELGHLGATHRLGALYLEGDGVARDQRRAFELYQEAAEGGLGAAQLDLARLYEQGRGTSPDPERAAAWYWSAAKNGVPDAQLALARMYDEGRGMEPDLEEALRWYQLAAEAGQGEAQLALGQMYHEGRGVPKDLERAALWLEQAAENAELPEAWYLLGTYYENGLGGYTPDLVQAAWCYEKAARDLHTEALYRMGRMTLMGRGVPRDSENGIAYLSQAGIRGHSQAMYELGRAYELGEGVYKSRKRAEEWYGKAAAAGHIEAMAALQDLGLARKELSSYERRHLEKKREEARQRREDDRTRKMMQVGRCEVYAGQGLTVEMRTRMDCLNRGGAFEAADRDDQGSFSTVDDGPGWDTQRRQLNRMRKAESRRSRSYGLEDSSSGESLETDWVVCYSRGGRDSTGRGQNACSSAMRKTRDRTRSWCRDRGYDSRRLFKHESSARSWTSSNCR